MTKPITDKSKIALEYPDNSMSAHLNAHRDSRSISIRPGVALILERPGADDVHKSIHMHINFGLFADIPSEIQGDCLGRGLARTPTVVICQPSEVPRHSLSGCWALALRGCRNGSCAPWLRNSLMSLRKTTA